MVDRICEILKLCTFSIIEDKVLGKSAIRISHIKISICNAILHLSSCRRGTRPCAIEVIDSPPLIEVQAIPRCLVINVYHETVVNRFFRSRDVDTIDNDELLERCLKGEDEE